MRSSILTSRLAMFLNSDITVSYPSATCLHRLCIWVISCLISSSHPFTGFAWLADMGAACFVLLAMCGLCTNPMLMITIEIIDLDIFSAQLLLPMSGKWHLWINQIVIDVCIDASPYWLFSGLKSAFPTDMSLDTSCAMASTIDLFFDFIVDFPTIDIAIYELFRDVYSLRKPCWSPGCP